MRLRALKEVWYSGRTRMPGDEFECDDSDFILIHTAKDAYGGPKAEKVVKSPAPALPTYRTAELKAETPPSAEPVAKPTTEDARRVYRRRDMKAET